MEVEAQRFVGQPVKRKEDPRLLTGHGRYVDDVQLPGMLYAAFVRSTYANARILSIDTDEARRLPGVWAVFLAKDLAAAGQSDLVYGTAGPYFPPLAHGGVAFVGDPVAIVVAETRALAEDAGELIAIDYEPADVVVDHRRCARRPTRRPSTRATSPTSSPTCSPRGHPASTRPSRSAAHVGHRHLAATPLRGLPDGDREGWSRSGSRSPARMTIWIASQGAHAARDHFAGAARCALHRRARHRRRRRRRLRPQDLGRPRRRGGGARRPPRRPAGEVDRGPMGKPDRRRRTPGRSAGGASVALDDDGPILAMTAGARRERRAPTGRSPPATWPSG